MKSKPLLIMTIGLVHFLEPLFRFTLYSFLMDQPIQTIFYQIVQENGLLITLLQIVLFPILGMAIISFSRMGLYFFMSIEALVAFINVPFLYKLFNQGPFHLFALFSSLFILNILVLRFFCLPSVRKLYLRDEFKWWKPAERYFTQLPCQFLDLTGLAQQYYEDEKNPLALLETGTITNISTSGLYVKTPSQPPVGELLLFQFALCNLQFNIQGIVKHQNHDQKGFGVEFIDFNKTMEAKLNQLVKSMKLLNIPSNRPKLSLIENLKKSCHHFFTSSRNTTLLIQDFENLNDHQ